VTSLSTPHEVAVTLVEKVTKQIITLCTGTIVVLVTALGYYFEYFRGQPVPWVWTTFGAGVFLLVSIIFGLLVYGALISEAHGSKSMENIDVYSSPVRWFAIFQWGTFAVGIFFLIASLYQISLAVFQN
jgi:hypothetical protein